MKRILFVHNHLTRFVQTDRDLLAERYGVTERCEASLRHLRPLQIGREVEAHDLVFCWFASWHSFFPVKFARFWGKPSIVVVGGYDTACLPQAGYGSQRGGLRRYLSRAVISSATRLLAFSEAAKNEAIANAGADPGKTAVLYLGVEPVPEGRDVRRERLVLTVGNVWRENLLRKGLLPFVQAASYLRDVKFVHVGRWCDDSISELRRAADPNVEFLGYLPDAELGTLYARASVYVQASLHEGFGLSVAEAMLAGCIPVVARYGSLPEVVGNAGMYLPSRDPKDIAHAVRAALEMGQDVRTSARARVLTRFSMQQRRAGLQSVLDGLAPKLAA